MKKLLILSVSYGQGHNAAAAALAESFASRGWKCRIADPCALAHPTVFAWTQRFYDFCVRRAPWLWGVTYAQTDTADWRKAVHMPLLKDVAACVRSLLAAEAPDVVLCTYPLYAYMLDALKHEGSFHGRYAVVVTDALVISRPWVQSAAPLVFVTDEKSRRMVCEQFGLPENAVVSAGFPVLQAFRSSADKVIPTARNMCILMGAHRPVREVVQTVQKILAAYPAAKVTVLAASAGAALRRRLEKELAAGQVKVLESTAQMPALMAQSHVYIGKAGAATMFECYAAGLPMVVYYALPGQEQGNLQLLMSDAAGVYAESADAVLERITRLLADGAADWQAGRAAMSAAQRSGGATLIAETVERRFPV